MAVEPTDGEAEGAAGTLWLVATPIGTLADTPPRVAEVLDGVDLVCAEDTRRTAKLLLHLGIAAGGRLRSLHTHNEASRTAEVLVRLREGASVALVSDAGTPVVSDPGFELVRAARRVGVEVRSVPGPSAFVAALAASGQPPLPATLVGFLPARSGPRCQRIDELAELPTTLVVLMSPHRLRAELSDLAGGLGGDRPATLLAELSKLHERAEKGCLADLEAGREAVAPRGEYVLVVGPPEAGVRRSEAGPADRVAIRAAYDAEVAGGAGRADALRATARAFGLSRKDIFDILSDREKSS